MSQLIFKFPFKATYFENDFYVSSNNFNAYKLIESCPNWPDKWINIFGPKGCGKTHLSNILKKKINSLYKNATDINNDDINIIEKYQCIIIDNYENNINDNERKRLNTRRSKQLNKYIVINSLQPLNKFDINIEDLSSRLNSFLKVSIDHPTDDLLRVIISKSFSDKQINLNNKNLEYIIKHIDRSYDKVFKFIKKLDNKSLSSVKSININLIKKCFYNE